MSHFADFHNISARFDVLIRDNKNKAMRVPVSKKHQISMSITRIGLFRTGGIDVDLISISKVGALFNSTHHALSKSQDKSMTIELNLNNKRFEYEAHIVQLDAINELYGIRFNQIVDAVDDYLIEFHLHPYYSEDVPRIGAIWLQLAEA